MYQIVGFGEVGINLNLNVLYIYGDHTSFILKDRLLF